MKKIMEKILFEHVEHLGECQTEYYQIIDTSEEDKKYRIYYSNDNEFDNFCIDVEKIDLGFDDAGEHLGWDYIVFDQWEGFNKASISYYCKILS